MTAGHVSENTLYDLAHTELKFKGNLPKTMTRLDIMHPGILISLPSYLKWIFFLLTC